MFLTLSMYDCVSKAVYALFPQEHSRFWKGDSVATTNPSQRETIRKIEGLKNEICGEVGLDGSEIALLFTNDSREISIAGHAGRAVLVMPLQRPVFQDDPFRLLYAAHFQCLPSEPRALAQHLRHLAPADLSMLVGLQREHQSRLDSDELRFVLGHEIKGHVLHNDNVTFAATAIISTTVTYVALDVLLPDSTIIVPVLTVVVAKVVTCVVTRFCEARADRVSCEGSPEARRGAEIYCKGLLVKELAESELTRQQGIRATLQDIFGWFEGLKYPSSNSRYTSVSIK